MLENDLIFILTKQKAMNTFIEIHDHNTIEQGTYRIWYKENGETKIRLLSESLTNSLLNMEQKHNFFMGQYRFKIESEYDFKTIILKGEVPAGF